MAVDAHRFFTEWMVRNQLSWPNRIRSRIKIMMKPKIRIAAGARM